MIRKQVWWMYWILVILSFVDFAITRTVLSFHTGAEANPLMAEVIHRYGINGILYVKIFWLTLLAGGILAIADHRYKILFWAFAALNVLMLVNLFWSDNILFRVFYS